MIKHHDLGGEVEDSVGWLVLGVRGELSTLDVDLDVEANVIFGACLRETRGASPRTSPGERMSNN